MNRLTGGFNTLYYSVLSSAARCLEQIAPSDVRIVREALRHTDEPEYVHNALSKIQAGSQFNKWREICIDLIDVELQMHRVKISLELLKSAAIPPLSQGEWVDYHYRSWAVIMQSLLHRVEKLTTDIVRKLIKPTNPEWKHIEADILKTVKEFKSYMKPVRDPVAHIRGPVDVLASEHRVELFVIAGGYDVKALFEPMADYQDKWHKTLSDSSNIVFAEVNRLGECLIKEVQWDLV